MKKLFFVFFLVLILRSALFAAGVLWIPAGDDWDKIAEEIIRRQGVSVTISPPAKLSETQKQILEKGMSLGKIEIASRMVHDPLPGLFYFPKSGRYIPGDVKRTFDDNSFFFAQRIADSKNSLPFQTRGFSNSPGALHENYLPLLKSLGFTWVAVGASTAPTTVYECQQIKIVPFTLANSTTAFASRFLVFDETVVSSETARKNLSLFMNSLSEVISVEKAVSITTSTEINKEEINSAVRPWVEDYAKWTGAKKQLGYLNALAKTREEIFLSAAKEKTAQKLPRILSKFYEIENRRYLAALGSKKGAQLEIELQQKFADIFRLMEQALPQWVFVSFDKFLPETERIPSVIIEREGNGFSFKKPSVSSDTFAITGLEVNWDEENLEIRLSYNVPTDTTSVAKESDLTAEIYVDINHRPRAGMQRTLPPHPLSLAPSDSWEYAVKIFSAKAILYYATIFGHKNIAEVEAEKEGFSLKAFFSRKVLRGHPERWGYSVVLKSAKGNVLDTLSSGRKGYLSNLRLIQKEK